MSNLKTGDTVARASGPAHKAVGTVVSVFVDTGKIVISGEGGQPIVGHVDDFVPHVAQQPHEAVVYELKERVGVLEAALARVKDLVVGDPKFDTGKMIVLLVGRLTTVHGDKADAELLVEARARAEKLAEAIKLLSE